MQYWFCSHLAFVIYAYYNAHTVPSCTVKRRAIETPGKYVFHTVFTTNAPSWNVRPHPN